MPYRRGRPGGRAVGPMRTTVDKGGGGSKIGKILRTSFMDGPFLSTHTHTHTHTLSLSTHTLFPSTHTRSLHLFFSLYTYTVSLYLSGSSIKQNILSLCQGHPVPPKINTTNTVNKKTNIPTAIAKEPDCSRETVCRDRERECVERWRARDRETV